MKFRIKTFLLVMALILFSTIFIGANNLSVEKNISENIEKETFLLDLDEVVKEDNSQNSTNHTLNKETKNEDEGAPSPSSTSLKEEKKIPLKLYDKGKKEIEGKIPESFKGEIKKTEKEIDENKKEITIKSEEHLDSPLTVYTDIEETQNEKDIEVYWTNEKATVKVEEYLDTNNNGLIDRIAWIVPHLSEQVFEISIDSSKEDSSNEIIMEISNINIENPFSFDLTINYTGSINCFAGIDETPSHSVSTSGTQILEEKDLQNGTHEIIIYCEDSSNDSVSETVSEEFVINQEEFEISGLDNYYLLGEEIEFDFNYPLGPWKEFLNPSDAGIPHSCEEYSCTTGGVGTNFVGDYKINISTEYYQNIIYANETFRAINVTVRPYKESIRINQETNFTVNFDTLIGPDNIIFDFKEGSPNEEYNHLFAANPTQEIIFKKTYSSAGTYSPVLTFELDGKAFSVTSPPVEVIDPQENNEAPEVTLSYPKNNELIKSDRVTFKYTANDDKKISSCTFELFGPLLKDGIIDPDHTETNSKIVLNQENQIGLKNFENGNYTWYVSCIDNQSKETVKNKDFAIQTTQHEYEEEIDEAMNTLEDFREQEDSLTLDEKNALDELGITEDLTYYSKRLVQIDQDLGNNLKYISDETLREKRTQETIDELKEIIEKIPLSIEIVDSTEYLKNTLTADMEEITKQYAQGKNIQINAKETKKLAQSNRLIQDYISTSTTVKRIKIEYKSETKTITSVKKELTLKEDSYQTILEQLPSELQGLQFKTKSTQLTPTLFEIKIEDLDEKQLIYYIEENLDLDKLKETETVLFEEMPLDSKGITGYFLEPLHNENVTLIYAALIIFLIAAIYFGKDIFKKMKMNIWKKEENVRRVLDYSEKAKKSLQSEDSEIAKEYYHKIKEIYGLTPIGFRKYSFPTIRKIQIGIDRRDMMNFVREYESAKREKRIEDSKKIYESIKTQYKKLPQKHREKVYERVIKERMREEFSL